MFLMLLQKEGQNGSENKEEMEREMKQLAYFEFFFTIASATLDGSKQTSILLFFCLYPFIHRSK